MGLKKYSPHNWGKDVIPYIPPKTNMTMENSNHLKMNLLLKNGDFRHVTLPETNSSPLKIGIPNRKVVFQPSIFRGYVLDLPPTQ